jgi:alpha-D-ribose 1-methylphosphonate 5-triphosphate synthase subunit PhnI
MPAHHIVYSSTFSPVTTDISLVWRTLPGGLYLLSTYKFKAAALDFILERESSDRLNCK